MFEKYLNKIRSIISPKTKLLDKDGNEVDFKNSIELKKGELEEVLVELEQDLQTNKNTLNNIDELRKSHSDDDVNGIEFDSLTKIRDLTKAISEVKVELNSLKKKYADAIVYNQKGEILFLLRGNETDFEPGKLGLPGGHVDEGESFEEAAKRELLEETNLKAIGCREVGVCITKDAEIHYFEIHVAEEDLLILDTEEHFNYKWLHLNELEEGELIVGLRDNLEEFLAPVDHAIKTIKKAFELGQISEEQYLEVLEKAGKKGQKWGITHKKEGIHAFDYYITNAANKLKPIDLNDFKHNLNIEIKRITNNKHTIADLSENQIKRYYDFNKNSNGKPFYKSERSDHKYLRREGIKGNYTYIYKESEDKKSIENKISINAEVDLAKNVQNILKKRNCTANYTVSKTDFGTSVYFNIYDENFNSPLKIRISDHSVQNIGRVFNEEHFSGEDNPEEIANLIEQKKYPDRFKDVEVGKYYIDSDTKDIVLEKDLTEDKKNYVKTNLFEKTRLTENDIKERYINSFNIKSELIGVSKKGDKFYKIEFEQKLPVEEKIKYKKVRKEDSVEEFEKAGKSAQIGEIREWNGQKMEKTAQGWMPVKGNKKGGKEEEKKKSSGKKKDQSKEGSVEYTPEQLSAHAKESSTESLQKVAEDKNSEPQLQQAAQQELQERGVEPSYKQKLKEKAKDWHKKQIEFYQSGALESNSEDRKGLKDFLNKKRDGITKALKEEVHELQAAGSGLKKFFSGKTSEISSQEKKAIKTISIHLGIVIGSMALTGGLTGAASKGIGALGKGIVSHYLEHAGLTKIGHVLAFAKAEELLTDEEIDKILNQLIDEMLKHIESGNISEEDWLKIGDGASEDFVSLNDEEDEVSRESSERGGKFSYGNSEGLSKVESNGKGS